MNLYTYVDNNPVNFVDPFGLEKQCVQDKQCSQGWAECYTNCIETFAPGFPQIFVICGVYATRLLIFRSTLTMGQLLFQQGAFIGFLGVVLSLAILYFLTRPSVKAQFTRKNK